LKAGASDEAVYPRAGGIFFSSERPHGDFLPLGEGEMGIAFFLICDTLDPTVLLLVDDV
jgi:hypothetical protein